MADQGISFGINIQTGAAINSLNQMRSALGIFAQQARTAMSSVREGIGGAFRDAQDQANQAQDTMSRAMVFQGMQQSGSQIAGFGRSITQGVTSALQGASQEAIMLETAMAEVSKLTGLEGAPLLSLRNELIRLSSTAIPSTAVELAEIAAAGGSLGVASTDLNKFVQTIAEMSVAFDMSTGDAGQKIGEVANSFKMLNPMTGELDFERVQTFGNVVNYLADTMATSEAKVINSMQRMSGNALYGFTENDLSAIAASMTSLGIAPEVAATSLNTTIARLSTASSQSKKAQAAFKGLGFSVEELQEGMVSGQGMETFLGFIRKVSSMGSAAGPLLSQALGLEASDEIARLAGSLPLFEKAVASAADSIAGKGSTVGDSMKIMAGTTEAQMKLMRNAAVGLQMKVGEVFTQLTAPFLDVSSALLQFGTTLLDKFPVLAKVAVGVGLVVAAFGSVLAIGGGLIAAIGAIGSAWMGLPAVLAMVGGAVPVVTGIFAGLSAPLLAALPVVGLFGAALAGVGFIVYRFWGPIKSFFQGVMQGIQDGFVLAQQPMAEFRAAIGLVADAFRPALNFLGNAFKVLFGEQMQGGSASMLTFGKIVGSVFGWMIKGIAMAISGWAKLLAVFVGVVQAVGTGFGMMAQGTLELGGKIGGKLGDAWQTSVARWNSAGSIVGLWAASMRLIWTRFWVQSGDRWNAAGAQMTLWAQGLRLSWTNFRVTTAARWNAAGAQMTLWAASMRLLWAQVKTTSVALWNSAGSTLTLWLQSLRLAFAQFSGAAQAYWNAAKSVFLLWEQSISLAWTQFKSDTMSAWQTAADFFLGIWASVIGVFQTFSETVQQKVDQFAQLVQSVFDRINAVIKRIVEQVTNFIPNFSVPAPVAAAASAVSNAAAPVANAASAVSNVASGAASALGNAMSGVMNAITGGGEEEDTLPGATLQSALPPNVGNLLAPPTLQSSTLPPTSTLSGSPGQLQALATPRSGANINNSFSITIDGAGQSAEGLADQIIRVLDAKLHEELAAIG